MNSCDKTGERQAAQAVADQLESLVSQNEQWLMQRLLGYASRLGYTRYTSTLEEAWRVSFRGLSESLVQCVRANEFDLEIRVDEDFETDPAVAFGVLEAERHRIRGVTLAMYMSLMKYYRQAYVDLIEQTVETQSVAETMEHAVQRFFDRVEIGFVNSWARATDEQKLDELQVASRNLTNEKNRYLTVFESLPTPALLLDASGRIENYNEAAGQVFGLGPGSGSAYYSSVGVGTPFGPLEPEIETFLRTGESHETFERDLSTDTGTRSFFVEIKRLCDVSGKFTGMTVVLADVSRLRRAEIEARENWDLYARLFNNMTAGVASHRIMVDDDGVPVDYVFVEVNEAFEKMTGLSRETVIGRPASEVLPDISESDFDWIGTYAKAVLEQEAMSFRAFSEPLGRWYEVSTAPSDENGFVTVLNDVTQQVAREAELQRLVDERTEDLVAANRTKDRFLAAMSHDLRTPLNSILGFSGVLLGGMAGELTDEQSRQLEMIHSSGEHLLALVSQILDLARIEAGHTRLEPAHFDLAERVRTAAESMRPTANERGLALEVDVPNGPIEAFTDPDRVAQILLNLLSNAVKFTDDGTVRVALVIDDARGWAEVQVSDTGPGIPADEIEAIFDEYFRLGDSSRPLTGTGLGLTISSQLADALGGTLDVLSAVGEGSTFAVGFPLVLDGEGSARDES